jgi:C4-dicarboxylate-specific signal transduction histidine kinase
VQPLAAVVANARAALNWLSSDNLNISQANAALEGVVRDGMSAGNIVHEMRRFFDRRRPNPRAIDLNTLIEQVISLQAPDVRDKGIAIDCELNPDLPVAFADAAQIQQVLFNLLVDAYEAMSRSEEPKKLMLTTDFTDDQLVSKSKTTVVLSPVWRVCLKRSSRMNHEEQSWPSQSVVPLSRRKGARLKQFDEKEE